MYLNQVIQFIWLIWRRGMHSSNHCLHSFINFPNYLKHASIKDLHHLFCQFWENICVDGMILWLYAHCTLNNIFFFKITAYYKSIAPISSSHCYCHKTPPYCKEFHPWMTCPGLTRLSCSPWVHPWLCQPLYGWATWKTQQAKQNRFSLIRKYSNS